MHFLAYQPENQRHLENMLRCAERLPSLSESCGSILFHHFSMTFQGRFYLSTDPFPPLLTHSLLSERDLIPAFVRVKSDLSQLKINVRRTAESRPRGYPPGKCVLDWGKNRPRHCEATKMDDPAEELDIYG